MSDDDIGQPITACTTSAPSNDFDLLPYPSMPITYSQPAHLAGLAALFGIKAPSVESARTLELGCASGGNIVPLAARFPNASFTGIDLSARHIDSGRKNVGAFTLGNITLDQGDLVGLRLDGMEFDYIICHGVFSWVPQPVRDAIFRICRDALAPSGVVAISYNVLPAWHLRMVVRDLCLQYAGEDGSPQRRVANARAALEQVAQMANKDGPYGLLLRTEASRLRTMPAAYIFGEFLAPDNAPCYVRDFIMQAERHGLHYLCEADLSASAPQTFDPAVGGQMRPAAGAGRLAAEQHMDFATGRTFRRSILVRRPSAAGHDDAPCPARLRSLHVASPVRLDATQSKTQPAVPGNDAACAAGAEDPVVRQALARLAAAYPATIGVDELVTGPGCGPPRDLAIETRLYDSILAMVLTGQASVSSHPLQVGLATQQRPKAWFVARAEAAAGQPWITSLRHVGVPAHPILRALLPYLDGTHDRPALQSHFMAALQDGTVEVPELATDPASPSQDRLAAVAERYVERMLRYLARHALLEPETG